MSSKSYSSRTHSRQTSSQEEPYDSASVVSTDSRAGCILTGSDECWVKDPIHFLMSSMVLIAMKEVRDQYPVEKLTFEPTFEIDFYAKSIEDSRRPYKLCHLGDMWQYSKRSKSADVIMTYTQREWTTPEGEVKTGKVEVELYHLLHERIVNEYRKLWEEKHPDKKFHLAQANKEFGNAGSSAVLFSIQRSLLVSATEYARSKDGKMRDADSSRGKELREVAALLKKHCADELKDVFYEHEYIPNWVEFKNIHNPILFVRYSVDDGPEQTYARRFVTPNYSKNAAYSVPKYWPPREYKIIYSGDEASGVKVN